MTMAETVNRNTPDRKIKAALQMAKLGFPVFPLRDYGDFKNRKKPLEEGWRTKATTDEATIRAIWTERPDCGVGAACDHHLVLDLDAKTAEPGTLRDRLAEKFAALPDTLTFGTGGGGEHVVMRLPDGTDPASVKNAIGVIPGVDVRTRGGYIVAPGNHLDPAMRPYTIKHKAGIAVAPVEIVAAIRRNAMRAVAGTDLADLDSPLALALAANIAKSLPECDEGNRNNKCHEYAHLMREYGISSGSAFDILNEHWNAVRVHPPLDHFEMRRTISSAYDRSQHATPTGYLLDAFQACIEQGTAAQLAPPEEPAEQGFAFKPRAWQPKPLEGMQPRPWVVEDFFCRGFVTAIIGEPGVSKSTFALLASVAIAANRPNLIQHPSGRPTILKPTRVLVYNAEDDTDEMDKRIAALIQANNVSAKDLAGNLFTVSGADDDAEPLLLARAKGEVAEVNERELKRIIEASLDLGIGQIFLDPVAELHNVVENSNDMMKVVGVTMRRIAKATKASVVFIAHARKGEVQPGDLSAMRGAGAMGGIIRTAFTVTTMTQADATLNRVEKSDRGDYAAVVMAKTNLGRFTQEPTWYRRVGVPMGPIGEEFKIGALTPKSFGRVAEGEQQIWHRLERIMLAEPAKFPIGGAYSPTAILRAGSTEELPFVRSIAGLMQAWWKLGAVQQGREYDVKLNRTVNGPNARWTVELTGGTDYLG